MRNVVSISHHMRKYNIRIQFAIRMKLFSLNRIKLVVPFTNGDLTHAYLGSNTVVISEKLTSTALLLIRETSGERVPIVDSTYYISH
jgi:hypothetical protein